MEARNQAGDDRTRPFVDKRRHPRFELCVDIGVYSRTQGLIRGYTVDISESGISAIFRTDEVPMGEIVRLEFTLPLGAVEVYATVRQRSAFRYGFEFAEANDAPELAVVRSTCRDLAVDQFLTMRPDRLGGQSQDEF